MKAKGVGNKPAPYLLVFTLFLGAVYLSAIFRTGYFCRQEGSEFMAKSKGGVTVSKVWELCQPIVEGFGLSLWDVRYVKEGETVSCVFTLTSPKALTLTIAKMFPVQSTVLLMSLIRLRRRTVLRSAPPELSVSLSVTNILCSSSVRILWLRCSAPLTA